MCLFNNLLNLYFYLITRFSTRIRKRKNYEWFLKHAVIIKIKSFAICSFEISIYKLYCYMFTDIIFNPAVYNVCSNTFFQFLPFLFSFFRFFQKYLFDIPQRKFLLPILLIFKSSVFQHNRFVIQNIFYILLFQRKHKWKFKILLLNVLFCLPFYFSNQNILWKKIIFYGRNWLFMSIKHICNKM